MNFYKYFFNWIYTLALRSKNDYTPKVTAWMFTSLSVSLNFFILLNSTLHHYELSVNDYCKILLVIPIFISLLNYFYFYHINSKIQKVDLKNDKKYTILIYCYIFLTIFCLYRSLLSIVPVSQ
jgi:hypothetical protein